MATTDVDVGAAGVDCAAQALTATPMTSTMTVRRAIRHTATREPGSDRQDQGSAGRDRRTGTGDGGVGQEELRRGRR